MRAALAAFALLAAAGCAAAPPAGGPVLRLDPRLDALLAPGARPERIVSGRTWLEGPLWDRRAGALLFSDIPENAVLRWREGEGVSTFLAPSGYTGAAPFAGREPGSNGLAFDREGRLLLAQHGDRRIARREADGRIATLADRYEGRRLNSPNDLAVAPEGSLYFTDPPFGLPKAFDDPAKELPFSGVYRLAPDGALSLLTRELRAPNGVALSPDGRTLYVSNADAARPVWMAYPLGEDGSLGAGRVFADGAEWVRANPDLGNPDGMKTDAAGNLFASGPGGVYVFSPEGTPLGAIRLGVKTSNCAWGGDGSDLYITASDAIYRVRTRTRGAFAP